jgi:predicted aspartyl protease
MTPASFRRCPLPLARSWRSLRWRLVVIAGLVIGALVSGVSAQVYHWVDDQGVIHYTTGIESVPEQYRADARVMASSSVDAPMPAAPVTAPAGTATIHFVAGAPIVVAVLINGAGPVSLVLDTGADRTMVAPAALARLGIPTPNTFQAEIRGVTGATRADLLWVESLEVGNARAGPLSIVAHDAGLPQAEGLLGRDFLSRFSVTIDPRASVVTLEPH